MYNNTKICFHNRLDYILCFMASWYVCDMCVFYLPNFVHVGNNSVYSVIFKGLPPVITVWLAELMFTALAPIIAFLI